ncbi:MAG: hydrogenase formation protein HypD, partial [Candidatus Omnitrophica bacterium]|nr:hydrogenase formation protein HypD [Candidatus Omnitrophota bacterium]
IRALLKDKDFEIDGFILPAHVSAIVGVNAYGFLDRMKIPAVIAGFEPLDMLQGIKMLIDQVNAGNPEIQIQYNRVVKRSGNKWAQKILNDVFEIRDEIWRGFGRIPKSGLKIRDEFEDFDAEIIFDIKKSAGSSKGNKDCICGDVLKGKRNPSDCRLFRRSCSPQHPKGPCMVSSEGSCSVYYKYGGDLKRGR